MRIPDINELLVAKEGENFTIRVLEQVAHNQLD